MKRRNTNVRGRALKTSALSGIAALAAMSLAAPAFAQLDEIVVSAERRADTLQNVPIALSAFTNADLDLKQIDEPLDLVNYIPNLVGHNNTGLGTANSYYIRGLGNTETIATFDPPVGTYVDEVYIARQNGNNVSFFDVERIEVARGPQGTLFGRNTTGGAVIITMAKPKEEFGGYMEIGYGKFDRVVGRGSVDIPINDRILTKISGFAVDDDGYVDNPVTGDTLNGQEAWGVRGDIRLLVSDAITWDISADYVSDVSENIANANEGDSVFAQPTTKGQRVANIGFRKTNTDGRIEEFFAGDGFGNDTLSYSITSNIGIDTALGQVNIITGYRDLDQEFVLDFFDGLLGGFVIANQGEHEQFSQEVKLSGTYLDGLVDVVAGAYYFTEDNTTDFTDFFFVATPDRVLENDLNSYAVYTQFDINPVDRVTVTVGGRWTQEEKEIEFSDNGSLGVPLTSENLIANNIPLKQTKALITPRFALEFQASDDMMVFASATQGFKSGGWNARAAAPELATPFFREKVWSYEAGIRSEWFDNRLRFNVTGFYTDGQDFQVPSAFVAPSGAITFITRNFADLENKGVEIELDAAPIEGLNVFANVGIQDASYESLAQPIVDQQAQCLIDGTGAVQGIITADCSVADPVRSPDFTATFGGSYEYIVPAAPFSVTPSLAVRRTGENFVGTSNEAVSFEDGYWLVNAGITVGGLDSDWAIIADCTNCTNTQFVQSTLAGVVYLNEPRRWNVKARYRF